MRGKKAKKTQVTGSKYDFVIKIGVFRVRGALLQKRGALILIPYPKIGQLAIPIMIEVYIAAVRTGQHSSLLSSCTSFLSLAFIPLP